MKERILVAADQLFYGQGIRAVGVDAVAAEAGISKRTLYNHFPSKDELIAAYLVRRGAQVATPEGPPLAQILGVFDNLAFRVDDDGTVTLLGQVTRPVLKDDAERAVKHVEGVMRVKNEIEVLPLSPDDDRIRRAAYTAIYGDFALSTRYAYQAVPPIHIIVKNGHITLEGVVANQMDKTIAGIRANALSGVFSVTNNLRVEE